MNEAYKEEYMSHNRPHMRYDTPRTVRMCTHTCWTRPGHRERERLSSPPLLLSRSRVYSATPTCASLAATRQRAPRRRRAIQHQLHAQHVLGAYSIQRLLHTATEQPVAVTASYVLVSSGRLLAAPAKADGNARRCSVRRVALSARRAARSCCRSSHVGLLTKCSTGADCARVKSCRAGHEVFS